MTQHIKNISIALLALFAIGCEDPVNLDSTHEGPQLVVDAWLTNESTPQSITLTESQDYFENKLPTPITGATVTVTNGSTSYSFSEGEAGVYTWTPSAGESLGTTGDAFTLDIANGTETYGSTTTLHRVPEIDSIHIYFEEEQFGNEEGYFAELYARDLPGLGDTYWVKSYRNDTLLNRPTELNIVYDATFDAGTEVDGVYFIRPIRFAVNANDDDGFQRPLNIGDEIRVEVHSISNEAFQFLQTVQEQTTNGDNTIFALPVANAKSNVINQSTGEKALGFFNVAEMSSLSKVVEE